VGFVLATLVGALLALGLLAGGYGMDGPCKPTSDWPPHHEEAAAFKSRGEWWPPHATCRTYAVDGSFLGEKTYPQPGDWVAAGAAFTVPFAVLGVRRWRRRRAQQA
jgi:hypothetical protein